jgi:hypothetical protein
VEVVEEGREGVCPFEGVGGGRGVHHELRREGFQGKKGGDSGGGMGCG